MHKKNKRDFLQNIILLAWSAVCLVIFMNFPGIVNHVQGAALYSISNLPEKLSKIHLIPYLADIVTSFLGMMFFSVACISLGMLLSRILRIEDLIGNAIFQNKSIYLTTMYLVGNSVYSIIFLTLASFSHLSKTNSLIILFLGFVSGLLQLKKSTFPTLRPISDQGKILAILSVAVLAVSTLQTSARISYDASAVYFSIAKLAAIQQQAAYYTEYSFGASTLHSVIQFSGMIQIFGDQTARMITWFFGVVNIIVALALAERVGATVLAKRIIPILIVTSTAFLDLMGDGKVDLISSAYSLIAVYWIIVNMGGSHQSRSFDLLSGFFLGFACILRPYNIFLLGIFVVIFVMQLIRSGQLSIKQAGYHAIWMVSGAAGPALYHLYINDAIFGSPFAFWNSVTYINPTEGPWDFQPEKIWIYRILYPVVVTFKNSGASLGNITPLVLVFLPTLTVGVIRRSILLQNEALRLTLSAGISLLSWITLFFTVVEVRYVLFLWIILFIPLAEIVAGVVKSNLVLLKNSATWAMILLLVFIFFRSLYISISTYSPVDEQNNPQCTDNVLCKHFAPINELADRGERVLTLSAFRYYLRNDLFACSTSVDEYNTLRLLSHTDPEAFWREVHRLGYSFVAFEKDYTTNHLGISDAPFTILPEWETLTPILVASESLQIVAYELTAINPPVKAETICRQDETGIWRVQQR